MTARVVPPSLPAVHALHLAELVKRWDVAPDELLGALGLRADELADPAARLPVATLVRLVEEARTRTGEPGLGVHFGLRMRVSSHGYLGFAAMTASTVREALDLAVRFAPTQTDAFVLRAHVAPHGGRDERGDEEALASLVIEERADLGAARDAIVVALMIGIWRIGIALTGRDLGGTAELAFPEPSYFARFSQAFPNVRFGQPSHRLVFDAAHLDLPITLADPAAAQLARAQCERALAAIGENADVLAQVRALLVRDDGAFRALEEIAGELHVSPRTLKRRLASHGTAYSDLVDEERRERALLLLRTPELSLEAIAERSGYSDVANFTRAFRRWTGTTPAAFRRAARGS